MVPSVQNTDSLPSQRAAAGDDKTEISCPRCGGGLLQTLSTLAIRSARVPAFPCPPAGICVAKTVSLQNPSSRRMHFNAAGGWSIDLSRDAQTHTGQGLSLPSLLAPMQAAEVAALHSVLAACWQRHGGSSLRARALVAGMRARTRRNSAYRFQVSPARRRDDGATARSPCTAES